MSVYDCNNPDNQCSKCGSHLCQCPQPAQDNQEAAEQAAEKPSTTMLHVYTEVLDWLQWAEHTDEDKAEKTLAFIRFQRELLASRDVEITALRQRVAELEKQIKEMANNGDSYYELYRSKSEQVIRFSAKLTEAERREREALAAFPAPTEKT